MTVAVTGATGFIGKYVIEELLQQKVDVIIASSHPDIVRKMFPNHHFRLVKIDLDSLDTETNYYEYFHKPDVLIHVAWQGLPNYNESFHLKNNLPGHTKFLENMIRNGLPQLVVTGTCMEYGQVNTCFAYEELHLLQTLLDQP